MVRMGFASDLALKWRTVTFCYNPRRFKVLRDLRHAVKRETGADCPLDKSYACAAPATVSERGLVNMPL